MGTRVEAVMVTPQEMRQFAAECMRWSDQTDNASHRELMIRVAKSWMAIAAAIERRLPMGAAASLPDLRSKLD
jgi:hypothetical protein